MAQLARQIIPSRLAGNRLKASRPAGVFAHSAVIYWSEVRRLANAELSALRACASAIASRSLRDVALRSLDGVAGSAQGAAAYAVLAPRPPRRMVVRALMGIQVAYAYADSVSERHEDWAEHVTYVLHRGVLDVVEPASTTADYFASLPADDGGYLHTVVQRTNQALAALPARPIVVPYLRDAVKRMIAYQCMRHGSCREGANSRLLALGGSALPGEGALRRSEGVGACASALPILVLVALAGDPDLTERQAAVVGEAYFPWVGALDWTLDAIEDVEEDRRAGSSSPAICGARPEEQVERLQFLLNQARSRVATLDQRELHGLLLSAMVAHHTLTLRRKRPHSGGLADALLRCMGPEMRYCARVLLAADVLGSSLDWRVGRA